MYALKLFVGNGMKTIFKDGVVCLGLLFLFCACSGSDSEDQKKQRPAGVRLTQVQRGDISLVIQATGTVAPRRETFIGPKVSGRIETFFVDEGDFVEKGKPLVRLEQVRFKLSLDEATAADKESRAQLKNLELKRDRVRKLYEKGVADKQLYDDTVTEVTLARARAAMAASRLERAREDFKDSVLYAPFSGFVVERKMNTGEIFSGMANEYVLHLVDTRTVKVEVNIFETKKQYIQVGKKVPVLVDAVPDVTFEGVITAVNPLVDPASRKFLVKIEIPNPDYKLESGMFARVSIPEKSSRNALLVPAAAVTQRDGRQLVFTVKNNTAVQQPVATGLMTHDRVEITQGLKAGDSVIVDGLYAVKNGTPLEIVK